MKITWFNSTSFRTKIFLSIAGTMLLSFVLIAGINYVHFSNFLLAEQEIETSNQEDRIEKYIETFIVNGEFQNLNNALLSKISEGELARIYVYNRNGKLLFSSTGKELIGDFYIKNNVVKKINNQGSFKYFINTNKDGLSESINIRKILLPDIIYYLRVNTFKKTSIFDSHLDFLKKTYLFLFLILLIIGGVISVVLSYLISKNLKLITKKIKNTHLMNSNKPLSYEYSDEFTEITVAYNEMIEKISEQSNAIGELEREQVWLDMAKQIAHELKNPLTPMKLMVENFKSKFDKDDPKIEEKVSSFTNSLLSQIRSIVLVIDSFYHVSKHPKTIEENVDIVELLKKSIKNYKNYTINCKKNVETLYVKMDPNYLTRIINNLIENAMFSMQNCKKKQIDIYLEVKECSFSIEFTDYGEKLTQEIIDDIMNSTFSKNNSKVGFGLLFMKKAVDELDGELKIYTKNEKGTTFQIVFKIN